MLGVIGPLTDPTATAEPAGTRSTSWCRPLPGYGFSGAATEVGWDPGRIALAWAELMRRLGYTRYVAQGGDVGAWRHRPMGRQAPAGLLGIHMNLLVTAAERHAAGAEPTSRTRGARRVATPSGPAASATSWSRPRGRRRSATPCWIHRSPWRPGCSTTTPTPTTRSPAPSSRAAVGRLTRDHILDNITLYWLTGTGSLGGPVVLGERTSRWPSRPSRLPPSVSIPVGFTVFPGEILPRPAQLGREGATPPSAYFHEADRGGHFAAWEEPELFATEIRAAFSPLR